MWPPRCTARPSSPCSVRVPHAQAQPTAITGTALRQPVLQSVSGRFLSVLLPLTWRLISYDSLYFHRSDLESAQQGKKTAGFLNVLDTKACIYISNRPPISQVACSSYLPFWWSFSKSWKGTLSTYLTGQLSAGRDLISAHSNNVSILHLIHFQMHLVLKNIFWLKYWLGYDFYFHHWL